MKRFALALVLLLAGLAACGQTAAPPVTVAWDAPALDAGGKPYLPDDVLTYQVYIEEGTNLVLLGVATAAQYNIPTTPYRANWRVGVSTLLDGNESSRIWSNIPADCLNGKTFLVRPKGQPDKPKNERLQ